ncbi:MAG TPA: flagellar hook-basal body complex protein FliE [Bryobacteraceae bacterium]|jgi:flagellar hook-basal body complex protein FliE
MNISGLTSLIPAAPQLASVAPASESAGTSFSDIMSSAINAVESSRSSADKSVGQFLSGEGDDLHSAILAGQRADLEFQMFMQVRNKVVSAYQEVMKMQL